MNECAFAPQVCTAGMASRWIDQHPFSRPDCDGQAFAASVKPSTMPQPVSRNGARLRSRPAASCAGTTHRAVELRLVFIGSARVVVSLAYIKTKNIRVSTGAQIINDWSFLLMAIFVGSVHPA